MFFGCQLSMKFLGREERCIDLSAECSLKFSQCRQQVNLLERSDNHEVNVAGGMFFSTRYRTIEKRDFDLIVNCLECDLDSRYNPRRFLDHPLQFREERGISIGFEVSASSFLAS